MTRQDQLVILGVLACIAVFFYGLVAKNWVIVVVTWVCVVVGAFVGAIYYYWKKFFRKQPPKDGKKE